MSETFMLIMSAVLVCAFIWQGKSGKFSWRTAAKRGTAAMVTLWLLSAAMFGISLANTSQSQIVMSNSYNPSGGGWFRIQSDTSRKAKADGLVSCLAIALGIGIVGGILIAIAPDIKSKDSAR